MRAIVVPALATVLVVSAMLYQARTVEPVLTEAPVVALREIDGFTSESCAVSEAELSTLPGDTGFVKRRYVADDGTWFQVSVVIGGRSKSSVHRPELCLPSQGFRMTEPRDARVGGTDWRLVTLAHRFESEMRFGYTFFNQAGFRTASHLRRIFRDVWDRSILGRIDRWVMVTVYSSAPDDETFKSFLVRLDGALKP